MLLNYAVPNFQVLIGDLDVTKLITKFEIGRPIHEMGEALCWQGSFELSHVLGSAITQAQISPLTNPSYFRPNQKICQFKIKSILVCQFYIQRYTYDRQTRKGQATIYQLLNIVEGDRPSKEIETFLSTAGTPLWAVIRNAVTAAFFNSSIPTPTVLIDSLKHTGIVEDRVTADDPINQAYDFASKNWRWLWVNANNEIKDVSGDPTLATVVFARSQNQCEIEEVYDNINFDAQQVIVTGAKKGLPPPTTSSQPFGLPKGPEEILDKDNRELIKKTETHAPKWTHYPELYAKKVVVSNATTYSKPAVEVQFLYERKTIEYKYWGVNPSSFFRMPDLTSIGKEYIPQISDFANSWKYGQLVQTVTTIERARGAVLAKYNTNKQRVEDNILEPFIRYVETDWCKLTYATPIASIQLGLVSSYSFETTQELTLVDAEPITQNRTDPDGSKPNIPEKKLEKEELPEEPQNAPDKELIDYSFKGQAFFTSVGWTPFRIKPLIVDVGFLPDQTHANMLAQQIGLREIRRRDAVFVTMPIPTEQLANGFIPLQKAYIHDGEYQIDEEIISLEKGLLKYAFTGGKVGAIAAIPDPPKALPYQPTDTLFLVESVFQLIKNQPVSIQLQIIGGTPPYSFTGTLPTGLSLSATGLLTGIPSTVASTSNTIVITDSLAVVTPVILKFSVVSNAPAVVIDLVYSELLESIKTDCVSEFLFAAELQTKTDLDVLNLVVIPADLGITTNLDLNDLIELLDLSTVTDQVIQSLTTITEAVLTNQLVQSVTSLLDGVSSDLVAQSNFFLDDSVSTNMIVQIITPLLDGQITNKTVQTITPLLDGQVTNQLNV